MRPGRTSPARRNIVPAAALGLTLLAACSDAPSEPRAADTQAPAPSSSSPPPRPADAGADASGPHVASEALRRCAASKGEIGSIAEAVARLNALAAQGGDGPCFVATLPRPLAVVATLGVTSAQPAAGRGAPRLFFMLPKLVISAVPDGEGSKVIELGEWMGTTRTLKGEIGLPVTSPLAADAPFRRVLQGTDRTVCATCHRNEEPHPSIANAFVSVAFQPEPGTFMTVEELEELHTLCTRAGDEGARCAMIHALFDFGELTQGAFSPAVATFLGN